MAQDHGLTEAERMAAALAIAIFDAHPVYANTSGWRGGVGGAAMTTGCSIKDPPPRDEWISMTLETPLRDYLRDHPEFDLAAAKEAVASDLRGLFDSWMAKDSR